MCGGQQTHATQSEGGGPTSDDVRTDARWRWHEMASGHAYVWYTVVPQIAPISGSEGMEATMGRVVGVLVAAAAALALSGPIAAEDKTPDATLRLSGGSIAAGIGFSWGGCTLTYKGKAYPIDVKGLSVGDVGVTKVEASGKVYNLKDIADFNGNYTGVGAGATAAGGGSVTTMKNQNGVTVDLVATTQGVKITIGGGGVEMKIKQ